MARSDRWLPPLDDQPGPAVPVSEARTSALVEGALDRALGAPARGPLPRLTRPVLAMAAALALALVAAAATYAWSRRHAPAPVAPPAAPASPAALTPPSAMAPPLLEEPSPASEPATAPTVSAPPRATRAPSVESTDLLARANELRAARRWRDAARTYERVVALRGSPGDVYAAQVAAADLRLEQLGDPRGALALYRAARGAQGGGALAEQVAWGIARSTRALGDARAEEAALRDYLARYPAGLFATDAKQRLAALEP